MGRKIKQGKGREKKEPSFGHGDQGIFFNKMTFKQRPEWREKSMRTSREESSRQTGQAAQRPLDKH